MIWRGAGFLLVRTASELGTRDVAFPNRPICVRPRVASGDVGHGHEYALGLLGATVLLLVLWLAAVQLVTGVWCRIAIMDRSTWCLWGRSLLCKNGSATRAFGGKATR